VKLRAQSEKMASIAENRQEWGKRQDWDQSGQEWSRPWGTPAHQWAYTWLSRIADFLPSGTILEIATGSGRWSSYLIRECERYYGVDLAEPAIAACRHTFADNSHATFIATDGRSLPEVPDGAIDFAFSADSLVHADREALEGYLLELRRVLRPGGAAFLHHSNLGAFAPDVRNDHWRDLTVSAEWVRNTCNSIGIACQSQELISWGQPELNDCFSLVINSAQRKYPLVFTNPNFGEEASKCRRFFELYGEQRALTID
jgi:SAM-dependent methyltransferase